MNSPTLQSQHHHSLDRGADSQHHSDTPSPSLSCSGDAPAPTCFTFLFLPTELRLKIYSHLIYHTYKPIDVLSPQRFGYWALYTVNPSLFRISKSITEEVTDVLRRMNDKYAPAIICRPLCQQKYRTIHIALRHGIGLDQVQSSAKADERTEEQGIDADVVTAVLDKILITCSYKQNQRDMESRLHHLRHFLAQTLVRLRRSECINITVVAIARFERRTHYAVARHYNFIARDGGAFDLFQRSLKNLDKLNDATISRPHQEGDKRKVTVVPKVTVRGKRGDPAFERIRKELEVGLYAYGHNVVCMPLSAQECKEFPEALMRKD